MEMIWQGILAAIHLLITGDPGVIEITLLTLRVSGTGTLISLLIGIPFGTLLALKPFPGTSLRLKCRQYRDGHATGGRRTMGLNFSLALRTLWILKYHVYPNSHYHCPGDHCFSHYCRLKPLPLFNKPNPKLRLQIQALGATRCQYIWLLLKEVRFSLFAAIIAGFGAIVSEIGASMAVGGNIQGQTRVLTTATVLEVSKGNFDIAIALSIIFMLTSLWGNLGLNPSPTKTARRSISA